MSKKFSTTEASNKTPEISSKSTKEQILGAYNEVLAKLNEKPKTPEEQSKQEKQTKVVSSAISNSSDGILTDLNNLKSKTNDLKENLARREAELNEKEKSYEALKIQVEQIPDKIKESVISAEEQLRNQLMQKYEFETTLKAQEYCSMLKLKEQCVSNLEHKVKQQETMIKELCDKSDMSTAGTRDCMSCFRCLSCSFYDNSSRQS